MATLETMLADDVLLDVLTEARAQGFLGPAPLEAHLVNGVDFAAAAAAESVRRVVDLGSGGGVPGLVVARILREARFVFVDRGARRCAFLEGAVARLGLDQRVDVVLGEAEEVAREVAHEGTADVVTARSFGPPAVTAEAGCRFLVSLGRLIVSEPPGATGDRWPAPELAPLGLTPEPAFVGQGTTLAISRRTGALDVRYPRRGATSRKRPLFS